MRATFCRWCGGGGCPVCDAQRTQRIEAEDREAEARRFLAEHHPEAPKGTCWGPEIVGLVAAAIRFGEEKRLAKTAAAPAPDNGRWSLLEIGDPT